MANSDSVNLTLPPKAVGNSTGVFWKVVDSPIEITSSDKSFGLSCVTKTAFHNDESSFPGIFSVNDVPVYVRFISNFKGSGLLADSSKIKSFAVLCFIPVS